MTSFVSTSAVTQSRSRWITEVLPVCAVLVAAVLIQLRSHVNTDVSWLLTVGERWLAGERPYVDFIEVNPPASILLSMPAVIVARLFGVAPETAMLVLTLAGGIASASLSLWIAFGADLVPRARGSLLWVGIVALLTLLPTGDFSEREHIAAMAVLPLLTAVAARIARQRPGLAPALLAGVGGGVAMAIKPVFGLALLGPVLLLLVRRGWKATLTAPELHLAWAIPALYGAMVPVAFPAFTADVLHRVLTAYIPFRQPWNVFALQPATFLGFGFGALAMHVARPRVRGTWTDVLLLAALGFEGAFLLQGKAWVYQVLPAVLMAAAALLVEMARAETPDRERFTAASTACLAVLAAASFAAHPTMAAAIPGLEAAITAARPNPTLMALSSEIAVGHPLSRDIGGRWVGTFPSQWISRNAERLKAEGASPEASAELDRLSGEEQAAVSRDLALHRPDVVLVDGLWGERYVADHPAIAAQMANYQREGTFGPVTLWIRAHEKLGEDALRFGTATAGAVR